MHWKPTWQHPPGSWLGRHCPGMEQAAEAGPAQGLEAGMVYKQSGSTYRLGLADWMDCCTGAPLPCSSCGPAGGHTGFYSAMHHSVAAKRRVSHIRCACHGACPVC